MTIARQPSIGIYEKALAPGSWSDMLASAKFAGYDFMEMSVDETPARLARLDWSAAERDDLRQAIDRTGIRVPTLCLSAHRRYGLGSADPGARAEAIAMTDRAIRLADAVGIRVIQVAGYFAYYEAPEEHARSRYVEALARAAEYASRYGVMLAIENIDTLDVGSVHDASQIAAEVDSPWLRIYPDVGNIAVNGFDVVADLHHISNAAVGIHLKDTRPAEPRRVPFGAGVVPFLEVFTTLDALNYPGPFMIEMWNDDPVTANDRASAALRWVRKVMRGVHEN